jgi:hypothetical protein
VGVLLSLAVACAGARPAPTPAAAQAADPDRWDRAACLRGEYPVRLDGRAWAHARQIDLAAVRQWDAIPGATARLLAERAAFEERCAAWLRDAPPRPGSTRPDPAASFLACLWP